MSHRHDGKSDLAQHLRERLSTFKVAARAVSCLFFHETVTSCRRHLLILLLLLNVFVGHRFRLEVREGVADADRILLGLIGLDVLGILVTSHVHQPSPGRGALEAHRCQKHQADQGHPSSYQKLIREALAPFIWKTSERIHTRIRKKAYLLSARVTSFRT